MSELQLSLILKAVDKMTAPIRGVSRSFKSLTGDVDKLDHAIKANIQHRDRLKSQIVETGALALAMSAPIKAAIDFESAMADVRKVVDFKQPDGLKNLGETIKGMSREIPISASGLAAIVASGGQLGVAEQNLEGFARTAAKMSVAFDIMPEAAGDAIAKLSNVFDKPIENVGALGDAINHLSDNTAAKAPEILSALLRIGGTSRAFGLSAVQAAALSGSFISLGKAPEVAATAINAMLMKLQTATTQGDKFNFVLKKMGLSANGLETAIGEDAQGALSGFLEKLSELDGQTRTKAVSMMFGQEYADDISLLVGSLDKYRNSLGLVADETKFAGSMTTEFMNRSQTTKNNIVLLGNALTETGINIGATLLPTVNILADALRSISSVVADFATEFPAITTAVSLTVGGLIAAKVAALAFGLAFTFLNGGVLSALKGITLLKGGLIALRAVAAANPLGLLITAATLIVAYWEPILGLFKKIGGYLIDFSSAIMPDWLKSTFGIGEGEQPGGSAPSVPLASPVPSASRQSRRDARSSVDVGGELKISIDSDGRPHVRALKSNNREVGISVDTGLAMAGG